MRRSLYKRNRKHVSLFTITTIFNRNSHFKPTLREPDSCESWIRIASTLSQTNSINAEPALNDAVRLLNNGFESTSSTLAHVVRVSTDRGHVSLCQQLHGYIIKHGFDSNTSVSNSLMRFHKKRSSLHDARKVFAEIPEPSIISWNSLISGYVQSGRFREGLNLFLELWRSDVRPNKFSFTAALSACGQLSFLEHGQWLHSKIVKLGMENGNIVGNCLIDMYGRSGSLEEALVVFRDMEDKDIISWNSVVASCSRNKELDLASFFFNQIPDPDTISYNELIEGMIRFRNIDDAIQILSSMPNPNSSSWNSILTGYVNRNQAHEALGFFTRMHSAGIEMDEFTFSITLTGIAALPLLTWGMLLHSCIIKRGLDSLVVVSSALVDMYSKCGQIGKAEVVFQTLPRKNLITWNTMISGYAHNGQLLKVIQLFEQMKTERDLKPDSITFLNVLAASSHNAIPIEDAVQYFESMINEYNIIPRIEHCCSMIRAMGRRGDIWRAAGLIDDFGFGLCAVAWKALLGACGNCNELKAAKIAAAKLIELGEEDDDYVYVMMSNIYAYYEKWGEVGLLRKIMRERGVRKEVGYSWIEVEEDANSNAHKLVQQLDDTNSFPDHC